MSGSTSSADLVTAARTIELADAIVGKGVRTLAATGGPDAQQVLAYDKTRSVMYYTMLN
ncbi:MAG: hypothetical protein RL415_1363 [Actinomycetota bacterium]